MKAILISDVHLDFYYTPGTIAKCNMPLCCRPENGFTNDPKIAAGPYGSVYCDAPFSLLVSMLDYIKKDIKPYIFFWTGDN